MSDLDHIDARLNDIDHKIIKLIDSLENIIDQTESMNRLNMTTNELHIRVKEHGKRISVLEDYTFLSKKRILMLQIMSVGIFLIATAGTIAQLF